MRNEKEMINLILHVAQSDERIRAVYMNGSRTNSNVSKDIFQDYDIVYVVTDTMSFINDENWINVFGELLLLQEPDKLNKPWGKWCDFERSYGYLMLFTDGNRIDLHIETKESMLTGYVSDKLTVPLLDKDMCLPQIPDPSDVDYIVSMPTESQFKACCNEFWWCLQNVAKGIWRDELPYAKHMFESPVRAALDRMVSWRIGLDQDFQISTGKMGKYFKKYLPNTYWEMYKATYSNGEYDNMWESIFIACDLFRVMGKELANSQMFNYPLVEDTNMTFYLKQVRKLPIDAIEKLGSTRFDG